MGVRNVRSQMFADVCYLCLRNELSPVCPVRTGIENVERAGIRTPDLPRVKPETAFSWLFGFHSVLCIFNQVGSLLSLTMAPHGS